MSDSDTLQAMFRLLNEIRSKLNGHDARFDQQSAEFRVLNKKIDDWQETTAKGVGLATHASIRNAALEAELEAVKRRPDAIEGSLRTSGH